MLKLPETWKPVVGFVGLYEVSDRGRVRSVARNVKYTSRYGSFLMSFKGRMLKQYARKTGHLSLTLSKNNKIYMRFVHCLVLESFVGRKPRGKGCRHLDGDSSNNVLNNLRWGTPAENSADMIEHGRSLKGEKHPKAKLTNKDVMIIRTSQNRRGLAKKYGVSRTQIMRITNGDSWAHV